MPTETRGIDPLAIGVDVRLARVGRENVETKGRRYLIEGRLRIVSLGPGRIQAFCTGTEETHRLGWEPSYGWGCSCAAKGRCSHLVALQLVTQRSEVTGG